MYICIISEIQKATDSQSSLTSLSFQSPIWCSWVWSCWPLSCLASWLQHRQQNYGRPNTAAPSVDYCREVINWQTILHSQREGLGFSPSIWGVTKYSCQIKWGDRSQSITVWYDKFFLAFWKIRPCNHCLWTVMETGFYRKPIGSSDKRKLVTSGNDLHMYTYVPNPSTTIFFPV